MGEALIIGTRGSELALFQARWVAERLRECRPGMPIEIEVIETRGDRVRDVPLSQVGGKGIFTKELENALMVGEVDLAVHSLKDMPTESPDGLTIAAVPARANPFDAFVCRIAQSLDTLPEGARIGTSSLRRAALLRAFRHDFDVVNLRGNVNTRVRKVDDGDVDAAILACAGLERLGRHHDIAQEIPAGIMTPAPGQGALALQVRSDDGDTHGLAALIADPECTAATTAERRCLAVLEGGCQAPIGAYAIIEGDHIILEACVCSPDGETCLRTTVQGAFAQPEAVGDDAARELIGMGAASVIAAAR